MPAAPMREPAQERGIARRARNEYTIVRPCDRGLLCLLRREYDAYRNYCSAMPELRSPYDRRAAIFHSPLPWLSGISG
jgi:hypothetical protein